MSIPDDEAFKAIVHANDDAVISIRGHVAIDSALSDVLAKALPAPHGLELQRISFLLKLDLAIALRGIRADSRTLFMTLNKIRNRFAHSPSAALTNSDATDIKSGMSEFQRIYPGDRFDEAKTPRAALKLGTTVAFYEVKDAARMLEVRTIEREEVRNETQALLERLAKQFPNVIQLDSEPGKFHEAVQNRVNQRLANEAAAQKPAQPPIST